MQLRSPSGSRRTPKRQAVCGRAWTLVERIFGPELHARSVDYPFLLLGHIGRRLEVGDIEGATAYAHRIRDPQVRGMAFDQIGEAPSRDKGKGVGDSK